MLEPGVGLALSGGGFRATLFNLGSLWRLNDLGWLPKLKRVTSVSGGSITNGVLALNWRQLRFAGGVATNFREVVAAPLMQFCLRGVDISAGLEGLFSVADSISDRVREKYEETLFGQATLQDLPAEPEDPVFVFYATSMQTGSSVRMSRKYLGDYKLGRIMNPTIRLSQVVGASSAFPPVLSPVVIETDPDGWRADEGAYLHADKSLRRRLVLTDGGVYDNMGLEAVWDRYDTVLVSDAGKPLDIDADPPTLWHKQTLRVLDICTEQQRALRKRHLVAEFRSGARKGSYWGITTAIGDYGLADAMAQDSAQSRALRDVRTRLNPFTEEEQGRLVNWGYALADAALRRYVTPKAAPGQWPIHGHTL